MVERRIEIKFGTTFAVKNYPAREDVVIDPGPQDKDFFHSARIFEDDDGSIVLRPGAAGTAGPKNVEKITGLLSLNEILAANRRGFRNQDIPDRFAEVSEAILIKNSNRLPKIIEIEG